MAAAWIVEAIDILEDGGHRPLALESGKAFVEALVHEHDGWSEQALAAHIEQERGVRIHPATVVRLRQYLNAGWDELHDTPNPVARISGSIIFVFCHYN